MTIDEQFNLVAREYDADRRKFLPCFEAFYKDATDFIAHSIPVPHRVLDLGAGTGLLTIHWYSDFPYPALSAGANVASWIGNALCWKK